MYFGCGQKDYFHCFFSGKCIKISFQCILRKNYVLAAILAAILNLKPGNIIVYEYLVKPMPQKLLPLTKIGINCILNATSCILVKIPHLATILAAILDICLEATLYFGNIVDVFQGHIRNLKRLVWFSPGGAKEPPSSSPTVTNQLCKPIVMNMAPVMWSRK